MISPPEISSSAGLIRTYDLLQHLIDDVYSSFEILDGDKESQYLRRSVVRTLFSFIEGIIHILKFELVSEITKNDLNFELSRKEKEVLFEEKIRNNEVIKIFIPTEENLKKTFNLTKKFWNLSEYEFKSGGQEYEHFIIAKKTRDRLTHPRTYYDVQITNEDMFHMASCFIWVKSEFRSLMGSKVDVLGKMLPDHMKNEIKSRV